MVWTVDTTGTQVAVTTGVTTDQNGRLVGVLAIGDGPSAVLDRQGNGSVQVSVNALQTLLDVEELQALAERAHRRGPR
ncbi:hypothetical protein H480_01537 [Amycolatopsis vancoresmycina DSM 44592]|uniref:Uncharacterized protein n=1 Tax=Amycolatopsis vancoresmycina DSM 44592 TaxID=1292037 RepID=R1GGG3_9PSEU|nr:hypothetical protein H480_01537 [Amycolatopsis vancoresmycina DSM 44592]